MLLDTHALNCWVEGDTTFPIALRRQIDEAPPGSVYFSPVSVYEIELKYHSGQPVALPAPIQETALAQSFIELPIAARHAYLAARFSLDHKDPWDRLLAAQSILEGLTVVTRNPQIAALGARTLW